MDVLLAKLLLDSKQSRRSTQMLNEEELDRFARQVRHKVLNPDPVLSDLASLKARVAELEAQLAAATAPVPAKVKAAKKEVAE